MKEKHIKKEHNVSLLLYHFVCPAKYRKKIFTVEVEESLIEVCKDIEEAYEIRFEEIGVDRDHVHFLVQWVPMMSPKFMIQRIKSVVAREMLRRHPTIKKILWWWKFWTRWYYVNTVGLYGNFEMIKNYVQNQWYGYKTLYHKGYWMTSLFDWQVF